MTGSVEIHIDSKDVGKRLKQLKNIQNGAKKAVMNAMNRTVKGMRTDAVREIKASYTIKKQTDVKEKIDTERASMSKLSAIMRSKGRPFRSIKFAHRKNTRPGKKGGKAVFLHVKRSRSGNYINGSAGRSKAFIATMQNGMEGIFQRTGVTSRQLTKRRGKNKSAYFNRTFTKKGRENIEQLSSPGVVNMLSDKTVNTAIQTKATERFNKEIDYQIKYLLSR